ncbi:MAG TPA: hypothetical protein VFJ29_00775, partial [Candidatus Kapabacteria bacterium]|nr:hypothetical protein [Candidatus Kapabacteria bacterium]
MKTGFSIFAVTFISIFTVHCAPAQTDYFVTVDPNTGAITKSTSFPKLQTVYSTAYDQTLNRFFFIGYGSDGYYRLYTLLAAGGGIVSSPVIPSAYPGVVPITNLQFDNIANKLYGFTQNGTHVFLVSINPNDGTYTAIDSFPSIAPVYLSMFDHHSGNCVFITGSIPQSLPYQLHIYDPAGRKHISDFYLTNQNGCSPSFIQCLQHDDS